MAGYKPEGYPSAAPYLIVEDARRTISFLVRAFAATELRMIEGDGCLRHGEVRIDDTVIMLGDALEGWPATESHVHVYVPDVDETYRRALEAGATSVQEPIQKQDEDKRGGVRDPGGVTWWIATQAG